MRKWLLLLFITGVMQAARAQTTVSDSLMFGSVMHYYRVYIPAARKCSLILHLHGFGSSAALEQSFANYMPIADTAGSLVAYPDGLRDGTGNEYWNVGWAILPNTDDVGYLSVLIDTLCRRYFIDTNCVFASGLSNGGFMCHKLACELSNKIAAIASVSGGMTLAEYTSCNPARAVPVLEIHATADATIPYNGTTGMSDSKNIDSVISHCAAIDLCAPTPVHTVLPHNAATTNGTTVDHFVYAGGTAGAACELYKINGGSHLEWPGASASVNNDFNASAEIWRFFNNYRQGDCTGLRVKREEAGNTINIYPNPSSGDIYVRQKTGQTKGNIEIQTLDGSSIFRAMNVTDKIHLNLPNGMYLLRYNTETEYAVKRLVIQR